MSIFASKTGVAVCALAGAALGYFILHPYTVVVYGLYARGEDSLDLFDFRAMADAALSAFGSGHMHMGLPFALLGGAAGLFFGLWLEARRQRVNTELRTCAIDTMKTLMVTLSHYLLNAVAIIGGFAWRIQKKTPDEELVRHVVVIRKEAEYIEAIVKSLLELQSVQSESYTKGGEAKIIDLTEDIKKRLQERADSVTAGVEPAGKGEGQ